ncbi:MAG TPA: O-antigen ligase family protein [Candidatus Izemoplasmatales bacterium]|nr:O-antigen ligase family protein [Candidatus Izemoplasmatales bacterium]
MFIWMNQLDFLGMALFTLMSIIVLLVTKNTIHVLPFFFNMMFMISQTEWSLETIPIYLFILPVILGIAFILHYIIYHEKWVKGKLTIPLLLMLVAMIFSIFNTEIFDINYGFYLVIGLFYVLIYIFFIQTIKGDNLNYILRLFMVLGLLISAQVFIYYLNSDDVLTALESKSINLGWGISNFVATYLIVFISASFYYIKTRKLKLITTLIITFEIIMLLFTLSRGGVLAFVTMFPLLIFYLYHGQKNKLTISLYLMILAIILGIIFSLQTDYFMPLFERFKNLDIKEGNGRVELWVQAYHKFRAYPIVGAGLFARVEGDYFGFYHNTVMHTLASLGLVGLVSLLWQMVVVLKIFMKNINLEKGILLIALIGANLHGMVDNVYFMPQFMILFFIVIAATEIHNHQKESYARIWRLPYGQ